MIDFQVKRDKLNTFESAVLKFDRKDIDIWVNIRMGLIDRLEKQHEYLQNNSEYIEDFNNKKEYAIAMFTMKDLEKRKSELEEEIKKIKKYIDVFEAK